MKREVTKSKMRSAIPTSSFDAMAFIRKEKERISGEINGMTAEQKINYFTRQPEDLKPDERRRTRS